MVGELRLEPIKHTGRIAHLGGLSRMPPKVSPLRRIDLNASMAAATESVCDPEGWAHAIGMLEAIAEQGRQSGDAKALYVIGVEDRETIAKIGVSANPIARLAELQGSHYRRLYLHAIVFTPMRNAVKIERGVLQAPERMQGEWLELSVGDVLTRALEYARDNEIPVVDGRNWFADTAKRTRELFRQTKMRMAA